MKDFDKPSVLKETNVSYAAGTAPEPPPVGAVPLLPTRCPENGTNLSTEFVRGWNELSVIAELIDARHRANALLRDQQIAELQARLAELEKMIVRVAKTNHLSYMQRTPYNGAFCELVDEFKALAQQVTNHGE